MPKGTGTPSAGPQTTGQEPVLPVNGIITSNYGWRHDPIDGGIRHHNGVDIAVPVGTSVKAIAAGRVIQSAWRGGYGNLVSIDHGDGTVSLYGHNAQLLVAVGEQVQAGQAVALSGSTGRSTGCPKRSTTARRGSPSGGSNGSADAVSGTAPSTSEEVRRTNAKRRMIDP